MGDEENRATKTSLTNPEVTRQRRWIREIDYDLPELPPASQRKLQELGRQNGVK